MLYPYQNNIKTKKKLTPSKYIMGDEQLRR